MHVSFAHPPVADAPGGVRREAKRPLEPNALLPAAGDEAGARRRAHGGIGVEIGEAHALAREAVHVRGADVLRAVRAGVGVAEVVDQDEDNVGPRGGSREAGDHEANQEHDEASAHEKGRKGVGSRPCDPMPGARRMAERGGFEPPVGI